MATGGDGKLSNKQIVRLCQAISSVAMETLALGYLDIDDETIKSLKAENMGNHQAFNRAIIKKWANKNSGPDQVKNLAALLYESADDDGDIDPDKIYNILQVTNEQARSGNSSANAPAVPAQLPAAANAPADGKLTDDMIVSLANEIDNEDDLVKIGTKGLSMKASAVKKHINNYPKSITTAAHSVFTDWLKSKENRAVAYSELYAGLRASGKSGLIADAWQ